MIANLKELKKFLQLCRDQGVESIRFNGVEVHLGSMPIIPNRANKRVLPETITTPTYAPGGITADTSILTDELTPDQLLFWSSEGNDKAPSDEQQ